MLNVKSVLCYSLFLVVISFSFSCNLKYYNKSSTLLINLLQHSNFQVSKAFNTFEFWAHLTTKILRYIELWSHLVTLRPWVQGPTLWVDFIFLYTVWLRKPKGTLPKNSNLHQSYQILSHNLLHRSLLLCIWTHFISWLFI